MHIESLRTLVKLRRMNVDAARQVLVQAINTESVAASASSCADMRIVEEGEIASSIAADDHAVESYARWLPVGREQARRARLDLERASQDVAVARSALILARTDERAAEEAFEDARAVQASAASKHAQDELDEAGARCRLG